MKLFKHLCICVCLLLKTKNFIHNLIKKFQLSRNVKFLVSEKKIDESLNGKQKDNRH